MIIQVDSRERPQAIGSILSAFDKNNIKWFRSKMVVADYCSLDNPRLVIDRKNNLQEVCGNLCQGHERFRNELLLAKDLGIQLILLIEHSRNIQTLSDVLYWNNPRLKVSPQAMTGWALYDRLCTIKHKYNVPIYFCEKKDTGKRIIEILSQKDIGEIK